MTEHTTLNPIKNKEDLKQFFNDDYVEHVSKIRHTIELQINHDLKSYMQQMHALINQANSQRELLEQIHSNTVVTERISDDPEKEIMQVGELLEQCAKRLETVAELYDLKVKHEKAVKEISEYLDKKSDFRQDKKEELIRVIKRKLNGEI